MEEAIRGASIFPTLTRPDTTQTGNAAVDDLFALITITTTTNNAPTRSGTFPVSNIHCAKPIFRRRKLKFVFMGLVFAAANFRAEAEPGHVRPPHLARLSNIPG